MAAMATDRATTMKAIVRDEYGTPDVLKLEEVERPQLTDERVLVRVHAASLNRADWYLLNGKPWFARPMMGGLRKPKSGLMGTDFAGTVEAVADGVTDFRPGDEVFGARDGAFAEYVCARTRAIAHKPAQVTFEEAAAVPIAGLTALQGLRDHGKVKPGNKVLVNGASGGVGTFAVQVAKALGAEVTAVCSTRNVEMARTLGADHVIDYSREDFTRSDRRYDVLFDVAGSKSWSESKRVLSPQAILVQVGAPMGSGPLGPLSHIANVRLASLRSSQKAVFFVAKFNREDMEELARLLESGEISAVIERRYDLADTADALRYIGEGHAQAKVVITI
jgi:NADPH:quinone reductase-like Zn-dependent oxidoreductase